MTLCRYVLEINRTLTVKK